MALYQLEERILFDGAASGDVQQMLSEQNAPAPEAAAEQASEAVSADSSEQQDSSSASEFSPTGVLESAETLSEENGAAAVGAAVSPDSEESTTAGLSFELEADSGENEQENFSINALIEEVSSGSDDVGGESLDFISELNNAESVNEISEEPVFNPDETDASDSGTQENSSAESPVSEEVSADAVLISSGAADVPPDSSAVDEICFIDSAVSGKEQIISGLSAGAKVVILNTSSNAVEQITEVLKDFKDVETVHIVSHGGEGHFVLGTEVIRADTLSKYENQLSSWSTSLSEDADILIYGCDVAKSESGQAVIDKIAELTGADVSASIDDTGGKEGNWTLEYNSGNVESAAILPDKPYEYQLATFTVTNTNNAGAGSLRQAITDANASAGADVVVFQASVSGTITLASQLPTIAQDLTIAGPGSGVVTVSGNNAVRILNVSGAGLLNVAISDLTLANGRVNGSGGAIYNVENLTVSNVVFNANRANAGNGGGIYHSTGALTVNNSSFTGNSASTSGGAVYIAGGSTNNINSSSFTNNTASSYGGGVYIGNNTNNVTNCAFSGNTATTRGGGVYINNGTNTIDSSTFNGNNRTTSAASGGGGAIYIAGGTNTIQNNTDISGNSTAYRGGGIYVAGGTTTVDNSAVSSNTATSYGGGVYVSGGGTLANPHRIINSTISSNTGSNGGGIYIGAGFSNLETFTVSGNTATASGGGVYIAGGTNNILTNSVISGNTATTNGGGAYIAGGTNNITGSTFSGNMATTGGGGVYISNGTNTIDSSTFNGNNRTTSAAAGGGGAIYIAGGTNTIQNNTDISGNSTSYRGGGVYVGGGTTTVNNSTVSSNTATSYGGGVYIAGGGTLANPHRFNNSTISSNVGSGGGGMYIATGFSNIQSTSFSNNGNASTISGGGACITGGTNNITGSTFSGNMATTGGGGVYISNGTNTIDSSTFNGNNRTTSAAAGGGGAIYIAGGTNTIQNNTDISGNSTSYRGGGIYVGGGTTTVNNSTVSSNTATSYGGGVYVGGGGTLANPHRFNNSTISSNTGSYGGGIYIGAGFSNLVTSTVSGNTATVSGGGFYIAGGTNNILTNSVISGNIATAGSGGGGYITNGTNTIDTAVISGNTANSAGFGGGGIYTSNGTNIIRNSTVSNNIAIFRGGGFYIDGGTDTIDNNTISGNSARRDGGGIYVSNATLARIDNSTIYNNTADSDNNNSGQGGGIYRSAGTVRAYSTIIAGNKHLLGAANDLAGTFDRVEFSLVQNQGTAVITNDVSNIKNTDPLLDPLGNYGGTTQTHRPQDGSPVINAGSNPQALANDQRGAGYARSSGGGIDIGAYENQSPSAADNTVASDEDAAYTFTAANFNFSDTDAGDALSGVQITQLATDGRLQLNGVDVILNQEIAIADINAGNLKFVPDADENGVAYANFQFKVGDGNIYSDSAYTMTLNVNAVNDQPVNTVPSAQTAVNGIPLLFFNAVAGNQISTEDVDAGAGQLQVTITVTSGNVTLNGTTGLTFTTGDGVADALMIFTGLKADINNSLNGMAFNAAADGNATIQIAVNDQGNTGAGGAKNDTDIINITVTPAPVFPVAEKNTAVINDGTLLSLFDGGNENAVSPIESTTGEAFVGTFSSPEIQDGEYSIGGQPVYQREISDGEYGASISSAGNIQKLPNGEYSASIFQNETPENFRLVLPENEDFSFFDNRFKSRFSLHTLFKSDVDLLLDEITAVG